MKSRLEVYARIKPCTSRFGQAAYNLTGESKTIQVQIPKNTKFGHVNNSKEYLEFNFNKVFDQEASQEAIFDSVAKPVVLNCLEGYNGTVFAYGQTGSGKTHTMSGAESWQMRGIIPRVLSFIFDEFEKRNEIEYNMYISFMEIYNENAYDLLDRRHIELSMENWNKVQLMEDDFGNIHLKNLSVHQCYNEQDGIDLLMMGNFIRQVSSTPLNQSSSRSHCIFTVALEGKHAGSDTYFVSKLHLVDLAGSERISKSQVEGSTLVEAKHINLSLTYLEQVIIALHEKGLGNRTHIPYRNSLMTTILKDSLGGNCKTVMVATLSSDVDNLDETISTARFAQRCSQLVNEIKKNEKIDMNVLVKKLESENMLLQQELEYYKMHFGTVKMDRNPSPKREKTRVNGKAEEERKLSQLEYFEINSNVEAYLNEKIDKINVKDMPEAQAYFRSMKDIYHSRMREYIRELNSISFKLKKYEEILAKKKTNASFQEPREPSGEESPFIKNAALFKDPTKNTKPNNPNELKENQDQENDSNSKRKPSGGTSTSIPKNQIDDGYQSIQNNANNNPGNSFKKTANGTYDYTKKGNALLSRFLAEQPIPETSENCD